MFRVDIMSRIPVYEQITGQFEQLIRAGLLSPKDKLPSVRQLSLDLSINPNTIQKAFGELDRRGLTTSVPGKGVFVSDEAVEILKQRSRQKMGDWISLTKELMEAGVSAKDFHQSIDALAGGEHDTGK